MFTHKGYRASPTIDLDAGVIRGKILEINDVVTFEGKTVEEARQEFEKSVDLYLEFCKQEKIEPEKLFSGRLPFRTTPETHRQIYLAATQAGKSINAWMEAVLSAAAQQNFGRSPNTDRESSSPSVRALLEERDGIARLGAAVGPFLRTDNTVHLFSALEKLLIGLDAIQPLLRTQDPNVLSEVIVAIENLLKTTSQPDKAVMHPEVEQSSTYRP